MESTRLTTTDLEKEITALLKAGKSKQEIYEEFRAKYGDRRDVVDILKNTPSLAAKKKYASLNMSLAVLLVALIITNFILTKTIFWTIVFSALLFSVVTYRVRHYFWITAILTIGVMFTFGLLVASLIALPFWMRILVVWYLALTVAVMVLPIRLSNKLCPKPIAHNKIYTDLKGNRRLEVKYEFREV